jgi:SnoaL-like polyketide cyclase
MRSAFPDLTCTLEDQVAEGAKVVTRFSAHGTHQGETEDLGPATGNRMEITGVTTERFSDGKVAESWDHYDVRGMMQQLGLVPEAGQGEAYPPDGSGARQPELPGSGSEAHLSGEAAQTLGVMAQSVRDRPAP